MKFEELIICGILMLVTAAIGLNALPDQPTSDHTASAAVVQFEPTGETLQWVTKDCQPVGEPAFVPVRIDPYVQHRSVDTLPSLMRGPPTAAAALSVSFTGAVRWHTPDADGSTQTTSGNESTAWQQHCERALAPTILHLMRHGKAAGAPLS